MSGGALIREARRRAGITQAELARRMGTSQSAVARWENGMQSPAHDTVRRAVEACGFDLGVTITPRDDQTVTLFDEYLALTPQQRVERLLATLRVQQALRKARRVDPAA
ncbi:MAG TPA: helix-turn-helix transcriptional regulator [Egibacteraceae bacterium]|jgi:transcriptional regulator with XRE-family HTH domain|nr:helix-turn-helix transcriptional regulator [Egibacteraceae bacterium]